MNLEAKCPEMNTYELDSRKRAAPSFDAENRRCFFAVDPVVNPTDEADAERRCQEEVVS